MTTVLRTWHSCGGVPFALLDEERMATLEDGDEVEIESDTMRDVSKR